MKILIIEDDAEESDFIRSGLARRGFECDCAGDGDTGLYMLMNHDYAASVIDNLMPGMPGLEVVRRVRQAKKNPPAMIMLSQCVTEAERISGLASGADDYMCKPFGMGELVARINAVMRRRYPECADAVLRFDDIVVDTLRSKVFRGGTSVDLQPYEYKVLEYLMRNAGQFLPAPLILEQVWDLPSSSEKGTVEVRISTLRKKLNALGRNVIVTRRGIGYGIE